MFGLNWKDVVVGAVTVGTSFIPGGVIIAPLAAAATSTALAHFVDGKSWDDSLEQGVVDGLFGAIPGGKLAGGAVKSLAAGKLAKLGLQKGAQKILYGGAKGTAKAAITRGTATSLGMRTTQALGRGLGAAYMNAGYNKLTSKPTAGIDELPVKIIS